MEYSFNKEGQKLYINQYTDICNSGICVDFNKLNKKEIEEVIRILLEIKEEKDD